MFLLKIFLMRIFTPKTLFVNVSTAKLVPIRLVISRPNHRPIYQPTAHLSHITAVNHLAAVNHCILRPLTNLQTTHVEQQAEIVVVHTEQAGSTAEIYR